jgi:hypothetical protein
MPVLPLWHHTYDKENQSNLYRIASKLSNNRKLFNKINKKEEIVINFSKNNNFNLCFGCQCYIKLSFLEILQFKYNINNLVNVIHNRTDRCSLERILGLLFCEEYPKLLRIKSLFGDIFNFHKAFSYNYEDYTNHCKNKKIVNVAVKVWTGR